MDNKIDVTALLGEKRPTMTNKQVQIIEAAVFLFCEKGYAATSTREIATRAQVSEGTIFSQYATKKELFLTIMEMMLDNILVPFVTDGIVETFLQAKDSLDDIIEAFLTNRMMLLRSEHLPITALKLTLQELPFWPEIQQNLLNNFKKLPINEIILDLQQRKLVMDWPVDVVARMLMAAGAGFLLPNILRIMQGSEVYTTEKLEEEMAYWAKFIAKALAPEPETQI